MKTSRLNNLRASGFTVAEMLVAVFLLMLLGGIFYEVLRSGLTLYAKNTAVNVSQQEAQQGILRLTRDMHASVSVPQLRDETFAVVSSAPVNGVPATAACVSFQNIASGPNYLWKDPNNPSLIMIRDNPSPPIAGQRLIMPCWGIEDDIKSATPGGVPLHSNVFLKNGQETQVTNAPTWGGSTYAITYYTERVAYLVKNGSYIADSQGDLILSGAVYIPAPTGTAAQRYRYENGELHLYKQRYSGGTFGWSDQAIVAKYISSPKPFYVPLNSGGSPDGRYVGVKLTARDPKTSNRGYLATASLLDTQVDYRSLLAFCQ